MTRYLAWWQWAWLAVAACSFVPVTSYAYQEMINVQRAMRVQLIERYSLWESDPTYKGSPQAWTRFASMLLNTGQLMRRVRARHGDLTDRIEEDFNRDFAFAQGKVVALYLLGWGMPLAVLYAAGWCYQRRRAPSPADMKDSKKPARAHHQLR